jgi:dUTP pyrophosphatase
VLVNHGTEAVELKPGDRVAQLLVQRVERVEFVAGELGGSERAAGGFGSTGR